MKKMIIIFISAIALILCITPTHAIENNNYLISDINLLLQDINDDYDTQFHIYDENEYYENHLDKCFEMDYQNYISTILSVDKEELYNDCIAIIKMPTEINVTITEITTRSTSGSKNLSFNSGRNRMTLNYKYTTKESVKYFDTSYKPTITVTKIATINYFEMSSYTGSFKNSNKSYSVNAQGNIVTYVGKVNKNFTVTFNLN